MLDGKKLFVALEQDYYDYEGYGEACVARIFIGPADAHSVVLKNEWVKTTWKGRNYTRKGVTKISKKLYQTVDFFEWLVKEKGFVPLNHTDWMEL